MDFADGDGSFPELQSPILACALSSWRGSELNGANFISPVYKKYSIASNLRLAGKMGESVVEDRTDARYSPHVTDYGNFARSREITDGSAVDVVKVGNIQ